LISLKQNSKKEVLASFFILINLLFHHIYKKAKNGFINSDFHSSRSCCFLQRAICNAQKCLAKDEKNFNGSINLSTFSA